MAEIRALLPCRTCSCLDTHMNPEVQPAKGFSSVLDCRYFLVSYMPLCVENLLFSDLSIRNIEICVDFSEQK